MKRKFKLGSHNSMTYLPPKKWYLYPFRFMAKCQSKTIEEQYNLGIRMFDLRIHFDKKNQPEFRHGAIAYKGDVISVLKFLNNKKDTRVRIILEDYRNNGNYLQECLFSLAVTTWALEFKNIKFFGGNRKSDWMEIVHFKYNPSIEDKYSSNNTNYTTGTVLDDWFPWLYAKFNNRKNIEKGTDKLYMLIDFIEIQ